MLYEKWFGSHSTKIHSICDLPGVKELCASLEALFNSMEPAFDFDGDKFSSSEVCAYHVA